MGAQQELGKLGYHLARKEKTGRLFRIASLGALSRATAPERRRGGRHHSPGEARANFSEWKEDAARKWQRESEDLTKLEAVAEAGGEASAEVRRVIADAAPRFRAELERRIAAGTLDEGGAGILARWGNVIDQLDRTGWSPYRS